MNPLDIILLDNCLFIDNSTLEKVTTCPRSAYYYMIRKRESADKKGALNFGSAVHAAMAKRYEGDLSYQTSADLEEQKVELMNHFTTNPQPDDEAFRTPDLGLTLLDEYHKQYSHEPFKVLMLDNGKPAVEMPFAIPLGEINGIKIIWTGRIDAILEWENALYVMDHKTTSVLGQYYFRQFVNSSQFIGYTYAAGQLLNRTVSGVLINALAIRKPSRTGKAIELARERIHYNKSRVDEWQTNTLHVIDNFLHMCRINYFPMHAAWCDGKYGACPYIDVCTLADPKQREILIESRAYQTVEWSPLK